MHGRALLILDFDGVICDSLPECFASSWYAYHRLGGGREPVATSRDAFARFSSLRPFIRSGEDYLLIQRLVETGESVADQAGFDALVASAGAPAMRRNKELLYAAREQLIAAAPEYWLRLNRIYPHMHAGMRRLGTAEPVYILSTKRASFIVRILEAAGIGFAESHVLYSASRPKAEMIRELLASAGADEAVFVDDQPDHFAGARHWPAAAGRIECRLATWGYVKPEWLADGPDYRLIDPAQTQELMSRFCV